MNEPTSRRASISRLSFLHSTSVQVVVAAVLMLATLPGRTQGLGLITEPLLKDLGLDRVNYANINLWATLLGAIVCLPAGFLIDRLGLRSVSTALVLLLGLTVWKISLFNGGIAGLFVLLFLTRALGQSALSVASITAIGKAAGRKPGLAMGFYSFLLSVFFVIAFVVVGGSVGQHGWRVAWSQIALALVCVIAPITLVFLRGRSPANDEAGNASQSAETAENASASFSLGEAMRTPAFWIFGLSAALFNLVTSGLGLFNQAVLEEHGFDQKTYVNFMAVTTLLALIGQLLCGWLARRQPLTRLMGMGMFLYALALGILPLTGNFALLWVVAALIGVAGGFVTVIFFAVWSQVFGRAHLGRIQGVAQGLTVVSSAVGPVLFAKCAAMTGSYSPVVIALSVIVLVMAAAAWKVALPSKASPC